MIGATNDDEPISTLYAPAREVDLATTLRPLQRGAVDPVFRMDPSGAWRTLRTPAGPATLRLVSSAAGIRAEAWGTGAEWVIAGVPELLGEGDDDESFDVSGNTFLAESLRRNRGMRLLRTRQVFEMMVGAIFEQKVTGMEARRSFRALHAHYGEMPPGPAPSGMRVSPTPEVWRRIPSWEWHRSGVGPERAAAMVRAAAVAASLERTLADGRGGPVVERKLRSIPGIGVWTAAETMQRAHGDPDSPSVGDYHLPALVGWALIGKPVDDDGMLELLSPWVGHRQRVMRLIEHSGFAKPRFGPRLTVQDHRKY